MLTLQQIKEDPERIIARLAVKGFDGKQGVNDVIDFDDERRSLNIRTTLGSRTEKVCRFDRPSDERRPPRRG